MRILAALCPWFLLAPIGLLSQPGAGIPVHSGAPQDVYSQPATMTLIPKAPGAHPGKVWVRSTDDGLHIWGKVQVNDDDLHWPQEKSDMLSSDHIEIWLSASTEVGMPPIGYGNQFGENDLNSAADCASLESNGGPGDPRTPKVKDCELWYQHQQEYRKQLERLFVRQWLASGTGDSGSGKAYFEDYATTAYANLKASFFEQDLPRPLEPRGSDAVVSEFGAEYGKQQTKQYEGGPPYKVNVATGYQFHFFIPWSAFPPAQQLDLRDLRLMVDVFGAAPEGKKMGALSTTSAQRVWGKPSSFNHLALDTPRSHEITPCRAQAAEPDMYETSHPAWFFPMGGKIPLDLKTDYTLENPAGGYMYDPVGVSPIFSATEHFWKTLPDGASVCGPALAYRKGDHVQTSQFSIEKQYFATRMLSDGWTLVRTGPDMSTQSTFGSGACGSCPVVDLDIYAIPPTGEIAKALSINDEFTGDENSPSGGDFAIARDWSRVTFFEDVVTYIDNGKGGQNDNWTATSYCLDGHAYKQCGVENNAKPPNPPNFKLEE